MNENATEDPRARARAIVASLREGMSSSDEVLAAFEELDGLPSDVVREELAPWVGAAPDFERLDDETRSAHRFPGRSLHLRTLALVRDADVLDLGPIAEAQLRVSGKSWDGVDREPEERLDGEIEGSFAGTLELRVLGDAESETPLPLFDLLRYAGDSGIVFQAGTTKIVAMIGDGCVETTDRRVRDAIREVLAALETNATDKDDAPSVVAVTTETAAKKKTAAKKTPAKKKAAAAKKTTAKKKIAVKKTAKKKTASNPA